MFGTIVSHFCRCHANGNTLLIGLYGKENFYNQIIRICKRLRAKKGRLPDPKLLYQTPCNMKVMSHAMNSLAF